MPLLNLVVMLIVAGMALYLINRYIPRSLQHHKDLEHRHRGWCLRLAVAGDRIMGHCKQLPAYALTTFGHMTPHGQFPTDHAGAAPLPDAGRKGLKTTPG